MRMHLDLQIRPSAQLSDAIRYRERIENTQGVGEADTARAGPLPFFGNSRQKIRIGTRCILRTYTNVDPAITRNRNMPSEIIEKPCAIPA